MIKGEQSSRSTAASNASEISPQEETGIRKDVKAISTTIMLLSQKLNYIVRNEKVLSKNILAMNEKIKKVDEKTEGIKSSSNSGGAAKEELESIKSQIDELYIKIKGIKADIDSIRKDLDSLNQTYATKAEIKELKYLLDAINPLEYVTYRQLKDMLDSKK